MSLVVNALNEGAVWKVITVCEPDIEFDRAIADGIEEGRYTEDGGEVGESEWDERNTTTPPPDGPE